MTELPAWPRDLYRRTEQKALLFYVVLGEFTQQFTVDATKFRSAGLPQGCKLTLLTRSMHGSYISSLCEGYIWEELRRERPECASNAQSASTCIALKGELDDPPTLNYFRDAIGVLTCLLQQGGRALYDPLQLRWWSLEEWQGKVFATEVPRFNRHVVILTSKEQSTGMTWVHTRGLRKFARPEISVHHVGGRYLPAVIDLCNRFIDFQARGGVIDEGQEVRVNGLPRGGTARHGGDFDDPEFNNVHVEIVWPDGTLVR